MIDLLVEGGLSAGVVAVGTTNSGGGKGTNAYKQIWSQRVVHLLSFFILAYCGVEVTIGG